MRPSTLIPVVFTLLATARVAEPPPLLIRMDAPARSWERDALPVGNGRLGAMVYGNPTDKRIQFNEISLWSGGANESGGYKVEEFGTYQSFGDLRLKASDEQRACTADYGNTLDLATGIQTTTWSQDGAKHTREVFASRDAEVIVVRWTADQPGRISAAISLADPRAEGKGTSHAHGVAIPAAALSNGLRYAATAHVIASGGKAGPEGDAYVLSGCDAATIVLAAATDYALDPAKGFRSGEEPGARVAAQSAAAAAMPYDTLKKQHLAWHGAIMGRVGLDLGAPDANLRGLSTFKRVKRRATGQPDNELEALLFQYGRYLLASCSRPGSLPANLQGLWADGLKPAWLCRLPYQHQHPDELLAGRARQSGRLPSGFVRLGGRLHPGKPEGDLEGIRRGYAGLDDADIGQCLRRQWLAMEPALLGLAGPAFLGALCLRWRQGIPPHYRLAGFQGCQRVLARPPEGRQGRQACRAEGMVARARPARGRRGARPADCLGSFHQHAGRRVRARHRRRITRAIAAAREKLLGPKIGSWGQIMEWTTERPDLEKSGHRHTSQLFAVYPGNQISMAHAGIGQSRRRLARVARHVRRFAPLVDLAVAHRDVGQAGRAGKGARDDPRVVEHNTLPNLFATHPPFQMDGNFGITAGMCEMLLQSHAGEIAVLPALPAAWKSGSFSGLRARGGFTIDATWSDGRPLMVRVVSARGAPCRLRVPDAAKATTAAGQPVDAKRTPDGILGFPAKAGESYVLAW